MAIFFANLAFTYMRQGNLLEFLGLMLVATVLSVHLMPTAIHALGEKGANKSITPSIWMI